MKQKIRSGILATLMCMSVVPVAAEPQLEKQNLWPLFIALGTGFGLGVACAYNIMLRQFTLQDNSIASLEKHNRVQDDRIADQDAKLTAMQRELVHLTSTPERDMSFVKNHLLPMMRKQNQQQRTDSTRIKDVEDNLRFLIFSIFKTAQLFSRQAACSEEARK